MTILNHSIIVLSTSTVKTFNCVAVGSFRSQTAWASLWRGREQVVLDNQHRPQNLPHHIARNQRTQTTYTLQTPYKLTDRLLMFADTGMVYWPYCVQKDTKIPGADEYAYVGCECEGGELRIGGTCLRSRKSSQTAITPTVRKTIHCTKNPRIVTVSMRTPCTNYASSAINENHRHAHNSSVTELIDPITIFH